LYEKDLSVGCTRAAIRLRSGFILLCSSARGIVPDRLQRLFVAVAFSQRTIVGFFAR
jgi:hypothetical protein